jgi:hypothetical protein
MPDIDTVLGWRGKSVRDAGGEKVGTIGALYLDADTDRPAYAGVHTGRFRRRESIVPLHDAREIDGDVHLPFTADQIHEAPNVDPDVALDEEQQHALHEHYAGTPAAVAVALADEAPREPQADDAPPDDGTAEVVRSEEEVEVKPGPMRPRERIRLKKYLVTDYVEKTIPVQRERVEVERDDKA